MTDAIDLTSLELHSAVPVDGKVLLELWREDDGKISPLGHAMMSPGVALTIAEKLIGAARLAIGQALK
jgi:hypothetical protein